MFERKEIHQTNQTEFVEQAGFLDRQSSGLFNFKDLKKNKNLLPFIILIFFIVVLVLLLILRTLLKEQNIETKKVDETKTEIQMDPLSARANELREILKTHNPTKQSLPFPQVDLEFNIN